MIRGFSFGLGKLTLPSTRQNIPLTVDSTYALGMYRSQDHTKKSFAQCEQNCDYGKDCFPKRLRLNIWEAVASKNAHLGTAAVAFLPRLFEPVVQMEDADKLANTSDQRDLSGLREK